MQVHEKIRKLRELSGKTQLEVAEALGLTQSNYSKIETGKLDITVKHLEEIAELLQLRVEDIIGFNEHIIFNMSKNHKANGFVINNQTSKNEKKLYEDFILSQKEQIDHLKLVIDKLLNKNNK
jgi:transcriptional regulator with XRE-family HTH domain